MGSIFSAIHMCIFCVKDSGLNHLVNIGASIITDLFRVLLSLYTSTEADWDMAMRLRDKTPHFIKSET